MRNGENEKQEGGQKWRQKLMKGKVKKKNNNKRREGGGRNYKGESVSNDFSWKRGGMSEMKRND